MYMDSDDSDDADELSNAAACLPHATAPVAPVAPVAPSPSSNSISPCTTLVVGSSNNDNSNNAGSNGANNGANNSQSTALVVGTAEPVRKRRRGVEDRDPESVYEGGMVSVRWSLNSKSRKRKKANEEAKEEAKKTNEAADEKDKSSSDSGVVSAARLLVAGYGQDAPPVLKTMAEKQIPPEPEKIVSYYATMGDSLQKFDEEHPAWILTLDPECMAHMLPFLGPLGMFRLFGAFNKSVCDMIRTALGCKGFPKFRFRPSQYPDSTRFPRLQHPGGITCVDGAYTPAFISATGIQTLNFALFAGEFGYFQGDVPLAKRSFPPSVYSQFKKMLPTAIIRFCESNMLHFDDIARYIPIQQANVIRNRHGHHRCVRHTFSEDGDAEGGGNVGAAGAAGAVGAAVGIEAALDAHADDLEAEEHADLTTAGARSAFYADQKRIFQQVISMHVAPNKGADMVIDPTATEFLDPESIKVKVELVLANKAEEHIQQASANRLDVTHLHTLGDAHHATQFALSSTTPRGRETMFHTRPWLVKVKPLGNKLPPIARRDRSASFKYKFTFTGRAVDKKSIFKFVSYSSSFLFRSSVSIAENMLVTRDPVEEHRKRHERAVRGARTRRDRAEAAAQRALHAELDEEQAQATLAAPRAGDSEVNQGGSGEEQALGSWLNSLFEDDTGRIALHRDLFGDDGEENEENEEEDGAGQEASDAAAPAVSTHLAMVGAEGPRVVSDLDAAMEMVEKNGRSLRYVSTELKKNRDLVKAAVRKDGRALFYADTELRSDPELKKLALEERVPRVADRGAKMQLYGFSYVG